MRRLLNWFTGAYTIYGLTNDAIHFPADFKEMVAVGKGIISDILNAKGHMEPIASKTHPPREADLSELASAQVVPDEPPPNPMALRIVQFPVHAYVTYPHQVHQQHRTPGVILAALS